MNGIGPFHPGLVNKSTIPSGQGRDSVGTNLPFKALLASASAKQGQTWNVTNHAKQRLQERGIKLSNEDLASLEKAAAQAQAKGAKTAYMILGTAGLVVNVPARTVVTAMQNESGTIVTQVDSVVFVNKPDHAGGSLPMGDRLIR